jgi:hypothetical protein
MKASKQKKTNMLNQLNKQSIHLVFILGLILLLSACGGRPNDVLNQSDMTEVLVDMHKADAMLSEGDRNYSLYSNKAPYYKYVLKKHGITQAGFDSSLVWYTKNPQKFNMVYNNVITELTAFQKEIKNGKYHPVDTLAASMAKTNIWNKRTSYILTKDSTRTHLNFQIPYSGLMFGDVYILRFLQRIAPEDSCKKQRVILRIHYWNGKTDSVYKTAYHDSLLRRYTFRFPAIHKFKIKSISGELLGSSVYKGKLNATVDSISLMREFNHKIQDSLRKMVEKADPTNYEVVKKPTAPINKLRKHIPANIRNSKLLHQK